MVICASTVKDPEQGPLSSGYLLHTTIHILLLLQGPMESRVAGATGTMPGRAGGGTCSARGHT